jgi:hypothetical protein
MTPAEKRSRTPGRKDAPSRSPSRPRVQYEDSDLGSDGGPAHKRKQKKQRKKRKRYTLFQSALLLQEEIVAASRLKEVRYDPETSLPENVSSFSLDAVTAALKLTAPYLFDVFTGAYLKCARSGRKQKDSEHADAALAATLAFVNFLKICNQRCDLAPKMMTLALMGKAVGKAV